MTLVPHALHVTARRIAIASPPLERSVTLLSDLRHRYLDGQSRHARIVLAVQILYAGLFGGWLVYSHTWPAPDLIAIFLLLFAFLAARGFSFLRDWSPFILLLLGYVG